MTAFDFFIAPFSDFAFMRKALAASLALSLSGAPLGVFMMLRRMTLAGDALAHAILPGVAAGALAAGTLAASTLAAGTLAAGLSLWAMALGGFLAALLIGGGALFLTRRTALSEDGALALLSLLSLAGGVTLVAKKGGGIDLLHLLFGDILAIDKGSLGLITGVSIASMFGIAFFYRRLVIEGFDPDFLGVLESRKKKSGGIVFFVLLTANLVAAFQTMGTLMALGLMILPALTARFWTRNVDVLVPVSVGVACTASLTGLMASFYAGVPSGPAIVILLGLLGLLSAFIGPVGGCLRR